MIEISDKAASVPDGGRVLAVSLADLLRLTEPEGRDWCWLILELEAVRTPSPGVDLQLLRQQIASSPQGLSLPWGALIGLADSLFQTINGIVVGATNARLLPPSDLGADIYSPAEVVFEVIDSSVARVYARDDRFLRRARAAFRRVADIAPPYRLDWY